MINSFPLDVETQLLASNFCCGNSQIDAFIRNSEALNDAFGKTYVWLSEDDSEIIGFYNISAGSLDYVQYDKQYKMGGAIHINELAIDIKYQGASVNEYAKVSDLLLNDCLKRIDYIRSHHIGFSFVTLQSTNEGYNLYRRHDFEEIEEDMELSKSQDREIECKPMYLILDLG